MKTKKLFKLAESKARKFYKSLGYNDGQIFAAIFNNWQVLGRDGFIVYWHGRK